MIPMAATWAEVEDHDYIVDQNGQTWRVLRMPRQPTELVYLKSRAGAQVSIVMPPLDRAVTKMVPSHEEAIETVKRVLGGVDITVNSN